MTYKSTSIWEVGSMICPMEKVSKYGETVQTIRGSSSTDKNTEKENINLQTAVSTKVLSSTISLMDRPL